MRKLNLRSLVGVGVLLLALSLVIFLSFSPGSPGSPSGPLVDLGALGLALIGAVKVAPVGESAKKWAERAAGASTEFGVQAAAAGEAWLTATSQAKANFQMAITAGGIAERFLRGVAKAGAAKFVRKINEVGKDRFASGVRAAQQDWATETEPFMSTVASLTLSVRKPRGDLSNYNRTAEVGKALNAKRLALLAGG